MSETSNNIILPKEIMENEKVFFGRIKSFLTYYRKDLLSLPDKQKLSDDQKQSYMIKCYKVLCSMYAAFKSKNQGYKTNVLAQLKSLYVDRKKEFDSYYVNEVVSNFEYFVENHLDFEDTIKKPAFNPLFSAKSIWNIKEFNDFYEKNNKLKTKSSKANKVTLMMIWIIQTYF